MRVLQAVHALPAAGLGGTELYTRQLAETLAADHEVAVTTARGLDTDVTGAELYRLPDPADWTDPTGRESGLESGVVHGAVDRRFADVLDAFDPDVVHLQHLKFLSANLPAVCRDHGVPCVATLHDFWTVCHREQLYRPDGVRCDGPDSVAKCSACYADARRRSDEDEGSEATDCRDAVERRTARLARAREAVDLFVAPSAFLRERFVAFGTPPGRIVHRRNGIRTSAFADTGFDPDGPLRVGYAGRVTRRKGVHVLLDAFGRVAGDAELHVFGRFDPDDEPYHARLRERAGDRVTFHGRYGAASTPYGTADVLAVPSLWYENSPLVVQEAFASGVPVVAGDVGGMAELVSHGEDGLTVPVGDPAALADALRELVDSPAKVRELRRGVEPPKSLDDHAAELLALYRNVRAGAMEGVP